MMSTASKHPHRLTALVCALVALAVIVGAHVFEALGYPPCPLCLLQRWPYYLAIPLAIAIGAFQPALPRSVVLLGLGILAALFAWGLYLGIYQAGAEWRFWEGPASCSGADTAPTGGVGNLLDAINTTPVASCTDPALRILGLSLAGWNAVVMAGLIVVIGLGLLRGASK